MASEIAPPKLFEPLSEHQRRQLHERLMLMLQGDEEDLREQRETFEYLKKVLDEDRFSTRKLFQ
ncbi:MAG TPA: hypothetical protein VFE46_14810 [Pirellulales bacterium]|jgi:hypothetical protein|nr:hypothetical protein [Pirellulales bacterium]